jgi:hypothetical protein
VVRARSAASVTSSNGADDYGLLVSKTGSCFPTTAKNRAHGRRFPVSPMILLRQTQSCEFSAIVIMQEMAEPVECGIIGCTGVPSCGALDPGAPLRRAGKA